LPSADLIQAKALSKSQTQGQLIFYNRESDQVEVFTQVFYGANKWKLGVVRASLDLVQKYLKLEQA
jgi:hypothetical protein